MVRGLYQIEWLAPSLTAFTLQPRTHFLLDRPIGSQQAFSLDRGWKKQGGTIEAVPGVE